MIAGEAVRQRVLELCRERKLSTDALCDMCGVTRTTINNLLSGKSRGTTIGIVKKLCDGFGISIHDFFDSDAFRVPQDTRK